MNGESSLLKAFKQTTFQLNGHGVRDIKILNKALEGIESKQESDIYGTGKIIEDFQDKMAKYLGKKHAVFFPSGTMAQQIALRIWSDKTGMKKVAYHPLCHLEIHEEDGLKELHHLVPILLADKERLIDLEDVINMNETVSCLLLELPQREIGGQLPDYETLEAIADYCHEKGIKLHLDGARLFEILPYYQKTAADISSYFDSVYVSFYKGIGGVAGAILASDDEDFIKQSKIWKRRHGGDLISLYPYIISADFYFEQRIDKMKKYYEEAKELAGFFNSSHLVSTKPLVPVSNMFHVHFNAPQKQVEVVLQRIYEKTGIGITAYLREIDKTNCYFELGIGDRYANIPKDLLRELFKLLNEEMKGL